MQTRMMQIAVVVGMTVATLAAQAKVLPEFMNTQQLTAWRGQHAAPAAGVTQATDEQNQFFTGKPYDACNGKYLFKYRFYSPTLARWTSVDPSGYPDGANNMLYVHNCAPTACDPSGLRIVVGWVSGQFDWTATWTEEKHFHIKFEGFTIGTDGVSVPINPGFTWEKVGDINERQTAGTQPADATPDPGYTLVAGVFKITQKLSPANPDYDYVVPTGGWEAGDSTSRLGTMTIHIFWQQKEQKEVTE